jgi:hypothetical protein
MADDNSSKEEKKTYRVIDRRPTYDDDPAPQSGENSTDQEHAHKQTSPAPPTGGETQPGAEPADGPHADDQPGEQRQVQIEDLVALILNVLRDQAVISLGMHFTAGPATAPNIDEAHKAATLYREFANEYPDIIQSFIPEEYKQEPPPPSDLLSSLAMAINLVQSQSLIQMGLIADPGTGLVVKNMPQAKKTIDLLGVLIEKSKPYLPKDAVRNVERALTDLRVNFVNQNKTP